MIPHLFDEAATERFSEACHNIAEKIDCDPLLVAREFDKLDLIESAKPEFLDILKKQTHKVNEAARHGENFLNALRRLPEDELKYYMETGYPTRYQIQLLVELLSGNYEALQGYRKRFKRTGGSNPAAHIVAFGVVRIFRRIRRKVTLGQSPEGGPSTDFGHAVRFALGEFGVRADWRRPAEAATRKYFAAEERLARCTARRHRPVAD